MKVCNFRGIRSNRGARRNAREHHRGHGIGRGIALALAGAGADIAVNYTRDGEAAAETVAAITALGRKAKAYRASVADEDASAAMIEPQA